MVKVPFAQVLVSIIKMEETADMNASTEQVAQEINVRMAFVEACGWDQDQFVARLAAPGEGLN